jgi:hypothetical protein
MKETRYSKQDCKDRSDLNLGSGAEGDIDFEAITITETKRAQILGAAAA